MMLEQTLFYIGEMLYPDVVPAPAVPVRRGGRSVSVIAIRSRVCDEAGYGRGINDRTCGGGHSLMHQ